MFDKFFRLANCTVRVVVYRKWSNVSTYREHSHYYAPRQLCFARVYYVNVYYGVTPTPKYRKLKFAAASPSCRLRHLLLTTVS